MNFLVIRKIIVESKKEFLLDPWKHSADLY